MPRQADETPTPLRVGAITGKRNFGGQSLEHYALSSGLLGHLADRAGVALRAPIVEEAIDNPGEPLRAELNVDRWIVKCPDCGGASFVWLEKPLFMCADCFNGMVGGQWRKVVIPTPAEVEEIEEITAFRPLPDMRNWTPDETTDDLRQQNRDRGHYSPPKKVRP